jgi:hypothetical protein
VVIYVVVSIYYLDSLGSKYRMHRYSAVLYFRFHISLLCMIDQVLATTTLLYLFDAVTLCCRMEQIKELMDSVGISNGLFMHSPTLTVLLITMLIIVSSMTFNRISTFTTRSNARYFSYMCHQLLTPIIRKQSGGSSNLSNQKLQRL